MQKKAREYKQLMFAIGGSRVVLHPTSNDLLSSTLLFYSCILSVTCVSLALIAIVSVC